MSNHCSWQRLPSGLNKPASQQVIPTTVAQETKSILETVVSQGTGTHAQTGQYEWGKTGTTTDNGDAWFVGATSDITVAVWVGFPNSNEPMKTLYNGGPVDGGTIPADIFRDIVNGWDSIKASERAQKGGGAGSVPLTTTSYVLPFIPAVTPVNTKVADVAPL